MKNLDRLIARAAETHKYFKGQTDLDYVAIDIKQANAIKAEVDARIAELTAELDSLKLKLQWSRNTINALANTTRDDHTREQARNALKDGV